MEPPTSSAHLRPSSQADRAKRTDALMAKLESRIAHDAAMRARLLGSVAAPGLVEPHRDHHAYALGADQADCELATGDARAMRGLMSLGPERVAEQLDRVGQSAPGAHVTRLWRGVLASDHRRLTARGAVVDSRRFADADDTTDDQRTVFEAAVALVNATDMQRDQLAYVFGADLFFCGLVADDALAMLGLMSIGPIRLAALLREAAGHASGIYVARLWPRLLAFRRDEYEARGRLVRWQRRWARYNIDHEAWLASPRRHDEDWRPKPMTARQRHLVRDTAIILDQPIPDGMRCGDAHDWLMAVGANTIYRKEM